MEDISILQDTVVEDQQDEMETYDILDYLFALI